MTLSKKSSNIKSLWSHNKRHDSFEYNRQEESSGFYDLIKNQMMHRFVDLKESQEMNF